MSNSQKISQMANAATPLTGAELVPLVQNGLNVKVAAGLIGAINNLQYQGTWNASTNTPTITSSVGTTGYYYIVSVAGTTTINGISTWNVGDWIIFSNTGVWQRISGGTISSLQIVSDTSSNTNYNIALTNVTSGLINTEYVDPTDLSFNPSTKTLTATNVKVNNTLTANNANITNLTSSNATITGGTLSNVTLTNATGGAINIANDTSGNTNYNVLMTTSSGGNVTTEYVDATNFTFNPSIGSGGLGNGALNVPSMYVHGYLSLADTGSTKPVALEAYPSGTLTFYTGSVENVVIDVNGHLGIGIEGTNYSTYAPLYVTNPTGPQVMINANNLANHGLEITYDSSNNALINNYNSANIAFGTNNTTQVTINGSGALGFGATPSYGGTGQVLISNGSSANPSWANASSIGGNISVTNDTSSNTNYNLAMTTASSGTITGEYVDNGVLTFNPSNSTLKISKAAGANLILSSNTDNVSTGLIIDTKANSATNTYGSNQIVFSQNGTSHWAFGGQNIGYGIPNTNYIGIWCYDNNTSPLNITPAGAWTISGTVANNWNNFGTTGQVLTSNGPNAAVSWSLPGAGSACTYAQLPSATGNAGARGFITDCTTTTFLATAAGGGTNKVPVVSNGTSWLVG